MRSPMPDELALPHFEERLWAELADLHRDGAPRRLPEPGAGGGPPRRPRRAALAAAGIVAVAGIGAAALVLGAGGDGDATRSEAVAGGRPAIDPDATILHKVVRQMGDPTIDAEESWYDEVTAAYRRRMTAADGRVLTDSGWPEPPALDQRPDPDLTDNLSGIGLCNPETRQAIDENAQYRPCDPATTPWYPEHAQRRVDYCASDYVDETVAYSLLPGPENVAARVRSGDLVVTGTEALDGRDLLRVENPDGDFDVVWLVDPDTYETVQTSVSSDALPGLAQVTTYERLPRTAANLALLSPPVPDGFVAATEAAPCEANPWPGGHGVAGGDVEAEIDAGNRP